MMRKLIAMMVIFALLCPSAGAMQMANPWKETSAEEMVQTIGLSFRVPEGAANVVYRMLESEQLAEVQFELNGAKCAARIKPAAVYEDISGMYYEWSETAPCEILWCSGERMQTTVDERSISLCLWYDVVPGLMYSVSAEGELNAFDLANVMFAPAQGEVDATPAGALAQALAECVGYAGTAGSSLKEAIAAAGLLAFAVEHADVENLEESVNSALDVLPCEWMQELSMNLEGIAARLEAAFEDYDSIAGLFSDAGIAEEMEQLVQTPDAQNKWDALRMLLP